MHKRYVVALTESERESLERMIAAGTAPARKLTHARILLKADASPPRPVEPGQPARVDDEYERGGVANLFLFCEPLAGQHWVSVTDQRTRLDWADEIKLLVDVRYPDADKIILVMDNLNTRSPASLYAAFPPVEAKRLADKLEIHHTPKHGRLTVTETELSVLGRQGLSRRLPGFGTLEAEVTAWQDRRNATATRVGWRFTTADARIKLKRLYPAVQE